MNYVCRENSLVVLSFANIPEKNVSVYHLKEILKKG